MGIFLWGLILTAASRENERGREGGVEREGGARAGKLAGAQAHLAAAVNAEAECACTRVRGWGVRGTCHHRLDIGGGRRIFVSGVNPRAPEAGYLVVGRDRTPGTGLLRHPPPPGQMETKRSTLAPILQRGGMTGQLEPLEQAAHLKPQTGGGLLQVCPGGGNGSQLGHRASHSLGSRVGVRERLSAGPIPPSCSPPGRAQQQEGQPRGITAGTHLSRPL